MRILPRGFAVCLCVTLLAFAPEHDPRPAAAREFSPGSSAKTPLAITHVTIVNSQDPPQQDMTVVVSGGVIEWIGTASEPKRPAHKGELQLDARGKFLIPGLWDMHTHVAGISADPAWSKNVLLPLLIANGITGIRDMGGDLSALQEWRREIASGALLGPQILAAGPMLLPAPPPGKPKSTDPSVLEVGTPEEARAAVDLLQKQSADFIKVIQLSREAYFAVAEESKKDGISFAGHVPTAVTASEASAAGQKSIEHIIYSSLALDCSSEDADLHRRLIEAAVKKDRSDAAVYDEADKTFSPQKAATLWATFNRNSTWVTPTLYSISIVAHALQQSPELSLDDPLLAYVPLALQKEWRPTAPPSQKELADAAWWQRQYENDRKLTGEMHRAGVRLLAGSDSLDRYVFPGSSLHYELRELVAAGLTPQEALQTATENAAEFLSRKDTGMIAAGRRADMVLLDADPSQDIANTQKISGVVLAGQFLLRKDLDDLLKKSRAAAAAWHANSAPHSQQ
jgi:imidazolonepropionase-like amidohydrolase